MTRSEREHLVERYLEGSMDFAQEENFFIQVALDDELRRTLKSYRIVDEAIRKERDSGMREHAGARQAVAGMLVVVPQAAPQKTETPSAQGGSGRSGFLKRMVSRRIVTTAAAAGLILFGWMGIDQIAQVRHQTDDMKKEVLHIKEQRQNEGSRENQKPEAEESRPETIVREIPSPGTERGTAPREGSRSDVRQPKERPISPQTSPTVAVTPPTQTPPVLRLTIDTTVKTNSKEKDLLFKDVELKWDQKK